MEVTIVRVTEGFRIDESGSTFRTRQVLYKIGDDGPFTLDFREDEFTPEKARARVEEEAEKIKALRGIR